MKYFLLLSLCFPAFASAQIGGRTLYDFLNLSPNARIAALGGINVSTRDEDVNFGNQNPALVNDSMHKQLSVSVVNYLSNISYGYAGYGHSLGKIGTFHAGIHYINYGKQVMADEYGNQTGNFSSGDVAFVAGLGRNWKRFGYGANVKLIASNYGGYQSLGLGTDIGGSYYSKDNLFCAGFVFKNVGTQLTKYTSTGAKEPFPFQMQAGISYKLKYMPMRFSVTVHNLQKPVLIFTDPTKEPETDFNGNPIPEKKRIGEKIARHFIFGTEFYLGKNLRLRAGYNHFRRQELRSEGRAGLAGFSLGAGIRISKFRLDYGYGGYHAVGGTHQFSVSTNLSSFVLRK